MASTLPPDPPERSTTYTDPWPPLANRDRLAGSRPPLSELSAATTQRFALKQGITTAAALPKPSFAAITRPKQVFRFPPIHLPSKPHGLKDGKPAVSFTAAELQPGVQRLQHSIIAKFTAGRPQIEEIRRCLASAWAIEDLEAIGAIDARHILIIVISEVDSNRILAHPLRKVGHSLFRLFRWTPDFHRRREPTTTTTWIKLPELPTQLYDQGYLSTIVSQFSRFIDIDHRTRVVSNPSFARVCIELDLNKPIPGEVWVGLANSEGFWQPITYENKLLYCSRCKLHGHSLDNCRKVRAPTAAREPRQGTTGNQAMAFKVNVDTLEKANIVKAATTNGKVTTTTEKTITSCPRKNGMNDPVKEQEWQVVNRKKKGKGKMEDVFQTLKEQDDNMAAEERIQDPRPITPLLPELIVPQEVMVKTAATSTAMVLYTESQSSEQIEENLEDSQQSQTQGAKAIIVHHEYDPKQSSVPARNSQDDESIDLGTPMVGIDHRSDGVTNDSSSLVEKSSAELQIPEEFAQKLSSYGDQIYCARIGGWVEPQALFLLLLEKGENASEILLFLDEAQREDSDTSFEETENHDVQCEAADPSKVPNVPTPKKSRQRKKKGKKKGTRSSARLCPKQKDDNFVWT